MSLPGLSERDNAKYYSQLFPGLKKAMKKGWLHGEEDMETLSKFNYIESPQYFLPNSKQWRVIFISTVESTRIYLSLNYIFLKKKKVDRYQSSCTK